MPTNDDLRLLITPALLTLIAEANIPFSKTEPLNFTDVGPSREHFQKVCMGSTAARDALLALSRLSPDGTLPPPSELDLMSFLPPPSSPEFPQQCYGLQLLLDQVSRMWFPGIGGRWQVAYFTPMVRRLTGQWLALPAEQRPDSWARWRDDVGVTSFGYWVNSRVMWAAPFLHTEDMESQKIGLDMAEELRAAVEAHTGITDPYRSTRDALLKDDKAFPREVPKGPLKGDDGSISIDNWAYWWCMILDSHWPIIERFGRYPYRNAILGRESTEAEKKWIEETGHFGKASPDVAKRILEDIEKGIWTPLGEE